LGSTPNLLNLNWWDKLKKEHILGLLIAGGLAYFLFKKPEEVKAEEVKPSEVVKSSEVVAEVKPSEVVKLPEDVLKTQLQQAIQTGNIQEAKQIIEVMAEESKVREAVKTAEVAVDPIVEKVEAGDIEGAKQTVEQFKQELTEKYGEWTPDNLAYTMAMVTADAWLSLKMIGQEELKRYLLYEVK
jgi:soluble cytochrome b562